MNALYASIFVFIILLIAGIIEFAKCRKHIYRKKGVIMSEIKPVYQVQQLGEWIEVDKSIFDELYIQNKFPHRTLYPAEAYEALKAENEALRKIKEAAENLFSQKENYHNEQKIIALTNALAKSNEGDRK